MTVDSEAECLICRRWPPAERPEQRVKYFAKSKDEVLLVPVHDMCAACEQAYFEKRTRKNN
jgi:hypothetical protein